MRIFVGNMPCSMSGDDLRTLFEGYGQVESVNVVTDRETGRPRGFGFVEMVHENEARKAIGELAERENDGRRLSVNEARPRVDGNSQGRGGFGGGGRRNRF